MDTRHRTFIASLMVLSALGTGAAWAEPLVYVTNSTDGTVSVIDTATGSVVQTIAVGGSDPETTGVSPDGRRLYIVANGTVPVVDTGMFDTAMSSVVGSIDVGAGAQSIAMAADGSRAYLTDTSANTVSVIDLGTNSVVGSPISVGTYPGAIALTPDGARAYVANGISDSVSVIDLATLDVDSFPVSGPQQVVISPDGTRAYVTSSTADTVSVIDTSTNDVVGAIGGTDEFPTGLFGIAMAPDGSRIYVGRSFDNSVSVIDTATESIIDTITVGHFPGGIAVTPDGSRAYVANRDDDTVSVIETATNSVIGTPISVGNGPSGVTMGPAPAVTAVVTDPVNPLTLYAGTAGAGMYHSDDGGESWTAINTGLTDLDITALAIASDGSAVYAGTDASGLFISTDGGASWDPAGTGLDPGVLSLHIQPGNDQVLFAGGDGGVYKTTDGGTTWQAVNTGLP